MQDESGAFQSIVINPQVVSNNITREWVNASYMSVRGTIEVDWLYENGKFCMNTTIPPNTIAEVHLPSFSNKQRQTSLQIGSGEYSYCM